MPNTFPGSVVFTLTARVWLYLKMHSIILWFLILHFISMVLSLFKYCLWKPNNKTLHELVQVQFCLSPLCSAFPLGAMRNNHSLATYVLWSYNMTYGWQDVVTFWVSKKKQSCTTTWFQINKSDNILTEQREYFYSESMYANYNTQQEKHLKREIIKQIPPLKKKLKPNLRPGGNPAWKKGRNAHQKYWKEPLRSTRILFCGHDLKFLQN